MTVVQFPTGAVMGFVLLANSSRLDLGLTQLSIQWVPEALTSGVKRPGDKPDHSPPSSSEVKNAPNYVMSCCLIQKTVSLHYCHLYWLRYVCAKRRITKYIRWIQYT